MTIKTSDLGGTDWNEGDTLFAADLNDTYGAVTLHRKQFSDATERTSTSSTYENSGTEFTLTAPVNAVITKIVISADLNNSQSGNYVDIALKINGTNLGSKYVVRNVSTPGRFIAQDLLIGDSENTLFRTHTLDTTYGDSYPGECYSPLVILDTSTTLTIRIKRDDQTARVKNVTIDVYYTEVFSED